MAFNVQSGKIVQDLNNCIAELKISFLETKVPIDDDNVTVHRFEEKLESLLLLGLKEKPGLLGAKKSYWDYICACFHYSKRTHEGIKFVKSLSELKTSLGKGRAFIRFCLMQKCLADTLQTCFMSEKITRDYYSEKSFHAQRKLWSSFLASLYDLNDLNFDLAARHIELDVSWPSFARKHFVTPESSVLLDRKYSFSSLHSFSSQNDDIIYTDGSNTASFQERDDLLSISSIKEENCKLFQTNKELCDQNKSLMRKNDLLFGEKSELEKKLNDLLIENQSLQSHLNKFVNKDDKDSIQLVSFSGIMPSFYSKKNSAVIQKNCIASLNNINDFEIEREKLNTEIESDAKFKSHYSELFQSKLSHQKVKQLRRSVSDCCLFDFGHEHPKKQNRQYSSLLDISYVVPNICDSTSCFADQNKTYKQNTHTRLTSEFNVNNENNMSLKQLKNYNKSNIVAVNSSFHENISNTLLEMKKLINAIPSHLESSFKLPSCFSHLNYLIDSLENAFSCDLHVLNKDESSHENNYVSSLETFATQQCMIVTHLFEKINSSVTSSKNLNTNLLKLYNLLRSYGFLKMYDEKKSNITTSLSDINLIDCDNFSNFFYPEANSNDSICSILNVFKGSLSKLTDLDIKINELQIDLDSSTELNNNLISKVQAHGLHLKGVTREIEEAQHLVSLLKEQHKKLQSTEGVLKYDLQEKRKLLTVLKQQLETTREDWNLVRMKNSKSEVEWQNLRKEFVLRHKQTSEESGFDDDKSLDEQNNLQISSLNGGSSVEENDKIPMINSENKNDMYEVPIKKSRLELLEEQCQLLYSNLLQGSKKRQDIDNRLEAMCKTIKRTETVSDSNPNHENLNEVSVDSSGEEISEDIVDSDNFANSPTFSSNVGSLNSDCSSYIAAASVTEVEKFSKLSSKNNCCSSEECDAPSCEGKLSSGQINLKSDINNDVLHMFGRDSYTPPSVAFDSCNLLPSDNENSNLENVSMTEVDSLLNRKKDLENSIKQFKIQDKDLTSVENSISQNSVDFQEHITTLEQEKSILQDKVLELEKKVLNISTELDHTTQQFLLSKASKEHEVAALQFQLNTEALKYERALKEFREQNAGLENMKQKITDQEQLILVLEEALTEIRTDRENERDHQWQELQDLQTSLEARDEECVALSEDLEKSFTHIEEERSKNDLLMSQLEELKSYTERDKSTLESEIVHLQHDSKQLQKRVVKLLKEKDILWQKTDQLAFMQKAKISDRWMDNYEANSCLGCKSNFSFMLRKHHCRHCGRIFCYSCSNNWLFSASSRKQIRVCNECYKLYLEMKNDTRRGSDVPQVEDDSEDEAGISRFFNPVCNSSFNSDEHLSITDSIITLPTRIITNPKKSTPIFASAPDLRYVLTQDVTAVQNRTTMNKSCLQDIKEKTNDLDEKKHSHYISDTGLEKSVEVKECDEYAQKKKIIDASFSSISTDLIEHSKHGFSGQFQIDGEDQHVLNILCNNSNTELQWSFSFDPEILPVTVSMNNIGDCNGGSTIYYHSTRKSDDKIILPIPGTYLIVVDNRQRKTVSTIKFTLKAKYHESSS